MAGLISQWTQATSCIDLLPFDAAFAIIYGIGHLFKRYLAFDCLLK
ncbi:hypothetical protein SynBIOSE41_03815 [Synechococcus sp. BIOS-E4-1]|nr:hypothetical protein SynBIOSE41_03815 [Synechococcus sp. BIOS-E4-1]